ncbi:transporter [Brevibacillus gelatini]|uniref:Transporter n=2 Tax=Brevibacillus TaxID=55080 RepID=A0A3M8B3C1_9BACL|nr:transporter [Brevibacillus gelatini]
MMRDTLKGVGWFLVALVTCPCHLVLILPLLAGTALGAYFMAYKTVAIIAFMLLFAFSLYMGWKRMTQDHSSVDCCTPKQRGEGE